MCRTTVIFGTLKGSSLLSNILVLNNCFSSRNVSKMVSKLCPNCYFKNPFFLNLFLFLFFVFVFVFVFVFFFVKSLNFCVVRTIRFCSNLTGTWFKCLSILYEGLLDLRCQHYSNGSREEF